jgi:hypothetical protein
VFVTRAFLPTSSFFRAHTSLFPLLSSNLSLSHLHGISAIVAAPIRCAPQTLAYSPTPIDQRHTAGAPERLPLGSSMAYRDQPDQPDPHHPSYVSPSDKQHYHRGRSPDYATRPKSRTGTNASDYQPRDRDTSPAWDRRSFDSASQPIQQPLKNAIGHAFDKSDAARVVDPDLIAQITEQVKRSVLDEIKSSGMAGTTHAQTIPVSPQQWGPPSPISTSNSIPPRDVYTPPSPKRTDFSSQQSPERDPLYRDPLLDGNSDLPTPRPERGAPVERERPSARPAPARRMATEDYTPIEKMWQRLFEPDGQPLPRLGQLLRGLALHLVRIHDGR